MQKYDMQALVEQLQAHTDEKYRAFNEMLTPGAEGRTLGVRVPVLRKIAGEIAPEQRAEFLKASLGCPIHEINMLHAMVLAKLPLPEKLEFARAFLPTINNWSVCDTLCSDFKPSKKDREALLAFLLPYTQSGLEFEVRFAYIMLMKYYIDDASVDRTLERFYAFCHEGYYARMGVAWGLCDLFIYQRDKTLDLLKSAPLDAFTHNKAIQKCVESYRVSEADKALLRSLRK